MTSSRIGGRQTQPRHSTIMPGRPPLERLSEADLMVGLRSTKWNGARPDRAEVARPCACGTAVIADEDFPAAGVAEHRETPRHRAWAEEWLA